MDKKKEGKGKGKRKGKQPITNIYGRIKLRRIRKDFKIFNL